MKRRSFGITLLELLIVMSIIGVLVGIGGITGSSIARRQAAQGAVATFQQSVWQGATAAASRGLRVNLVRQGNDLQLINASNDELLRRFELPAGVDIQAGNPILRFLPPGKVDDGSLKALKDGLIIETSEGRYRVEISVIGEVRSVRLGDS